VVKKKVGKQAKCVECGSTEFEAGFTIEVRHVPVTVSDRGLIIYDDTKGDSSGWDTIEQPELSCKRCGHVHRLERIGSDKMDRDTYKVVGNQAGDKEE
jgi:uncharacterized Zn finger protein